MFPPKDRLTICFAHAAYQLHERFLRRQLTIHSFSVRTLDEFEQRIGEADVLVVSGLWRNDMLDRAQRLRFIQSISAGTDQFDRAKLTERGIRLASAQGVNVRAVSEHAMALMLALTRKLPEARDNQAKHHSKVQSLARQVSSDGVFVSDHLWQPDLGIGIAEWERKRAGQSSRRPWFLPARGSASRPRSPR